MIYNPQTLWPYTRLKRRWLHVFDCLGLLLGVGAILPRLPHAEQQPFSALLLSMAFIAWLLRVREPRTFRRERSAFE